MSTRVVNGVVARCLLEPGYLDQLAQDPQTELAALPLDDATRTELGRLDLEQVRRFGGFISKVQHNDLWDHFPYSRALLKFYGAELDTFAAYRYEHLSLLRAGRPSRDAKTASFLSFLENRLRGPAGRDCPGLLDVLTHERLQWEIARELLDFDSAEADSLARDSVDTEFDDRRIVVARDVLRAAALHYHPLELIARLREGGQGLTDIVPRPVCFCYQGCKDAESISVVEVDTLTATVLAGVDGRRSVREVISVAHAMLPEAARSDLTAVLHEAIAIRLVQVTDPAPTSARCHADHTPR
jgi:hypothetical protein